MESLYYIPEGCICQGDGLMGMKCDAKEHAVRKDRMLRAALQGLMDMVSKGQLVRPTREDAEMGWAMRQIPLVTALKAADDALDRTKDLK